IRRWTDVEPRSIAAPGRRDTCGRAGPGRSDGAAAPADQAVPVAPLEPPVDRLGDPDVRAEDARRRLAAPVVALVADPDGRRADRDWSPRLPSSSADSSSISSRASARRAVRLSRFFIVAFSTRPTRTA